MRRIEPHSLWIGHAGDLGDIKAIRDGGFVAIVDLAINEPPRVYARDTAYLRFPLHDGAGNTDAMLSAAVATIAEFVLRDEPVLVCCSAGMSRSVIVAAGVVSNVRHVALDHAIGLIAAAGPADVSMDLRESMRRVMKQESPG